MGSAATIVFARQDLSIPGAPISDGKSADHVDAVQRRFFALVSDSKPDAIVLDLSKSPLSGTDTILAIRRHSAVPILVVCHPAHPVVKNYRNAGAADFIAARVDILGLSQAIRRIRRVAAASGAYRRRHKADFLFAGMAYRSEGNVLTGNTGSAVALTNSEGRLLTHLLTRPWTICSRAEIHGLLYGRDRAVGSRALEAVVNRLRKKLYCLGERAGQSLIKTKLRYGYWLAADVTRLPHSPSARPW